MVIEVGCGTGDIIGALSLPTGVDRYGVDINPDFIQFCQDFHGPKNASEGSGILSFQVADALHLMDWYKAQGFDKKYSKPLITCVNNTLNIMPEHLRGKVVDEMIAIAGKDGLCLATYWNGNFFSHAVMNYYQKNPALCGVFDPNTHVNWEERCLLTPTNYSTEWHFPHEVQQLLRAYDVDVPNIEDTLKPTTTHICCDRLAIFIWFDSTSTSNAKGYYDSDDAQKFYSTIWGQDTIHLGRYDLLTPEEKAQPVSQQVARAQALHELDFVQIIQDKLLHAQPKLRIADFGCGYGGLLRRLHENQMVWTATGIDISSQMCNQARRLNQEKKMEKELTILEESYLDVSLDNESQDLVISMDALLHVGPERQARAVQEAARVLRPGGWMIFTDIMEQDQVNSKEMQPIYDRIKLSKMGTVANYKNALEAQGFSNFEHIAHSENVATHYGSILQVLEETGDAAGISQEYQANMKQGLTVWRDLAPNNIVWGFCLAQKTDKVVA